MTFALIPRKLSFLPRPELTNTTASFPNRAAKFLQPVCGGSVTSMIASPIEIRVPAAAGEPVITNETLLEFHGAELSGCLGHIDTSFSYQSTSQYLPNLKPTSWYEATLTKPSVSCS